MTRLIAFVKTWSRYDWLWLGWLGFGLSIEAAALRDARAGGTLSDALWWLTSNNREARGKWRAIRIVALAATAWAVAHVWLRRNWV